MCHYSSIKTLCYNYDVFNSELCLYCLLPAFIHLELCLHTNYINSYYILTNNCTYFFIGYLLSLTVM